MLTKKSYFRAPAARKVQIGRIVKTAIFEELERHEDGRLGAVLSTLTDQESAELYTETMTDYGRGVLFPLGSDAHHKRQRNREHLIKVMKSRKREQA